MTESNLTPEQNTEPTDSELVKQALAEQGLYAGLDGLEGLHGANGFWEEQAYGTRLYYDGAGYMHRSALGCAIKALASLMRERAKLKNDLSQAQEALTQIKSLVVGERSPNWSLESPTDCTRTYNTRGRIANICDIALSQQRSEQP